MVTRNPQAIVIRCGQYCINSIGLVGHTKCLKLSKKIISDILQFVNIKYTC